MAAFGIQWSDPDTGSSFMLSVDGPNPSGWYDVLVEIEQGDSEEILKTAQGILEERGFYRPRDNWLDWDNINTTYMRRMSVFHQTKVRKKQEEKSNDEEE